MEIEYTYRYMTAMRIGATEHSSRLYVQEQIVSYLYIVSPFDSFSSVSSFHKIGIVSYLAMKSNRVWLFLNEIYCMSAWLSWENFWVTNTVMNKNSMVILKRSNFL
ncbi:hypothetical protein RYX36_032807 [Vicia faba]